MQCPTLGENRGSGSGVLSLHICDQVSYIHQHGLKEEQTLLIPGGQWDLQNQTAIFVLQEHICNTTRGNLWRFLCYISCAEIVKLI